MGNKSDLRRRLVGASFLAVAVLMLIVGQVWDTMLRERLSKPGFLLFWMICFLFTFLAILVAFLDLSVVRRRTHAEQRALLEDTLTEIAREKEAKARKPSPHGNSHKS